MPRGYRRFRVALLWALGGCGPIIDAASFPSRPGRARPGDLLGPFEGTVVDFETDRPVAGAVVEASWAFERGTGLVGPAGAAMHSLVTDAEGRYRIPALTDLPAGPSGRVRRFTLIVYKRGYTAWRSDRLFPDGRPRRDFSQYENRVRLVRWDEGASHARHLAFLGGGDLIRKASAWELHAAGLQDSGARVRMTEGEQSAPGGRPLLNAAELLSEDDLRRVTGFAGKLTVGRLTDMPRTEFYDTVYFRSAADDEREDVAIRFWHLGEAGAEQQYGELRAELPPPEAEHEIGDASLRVTVAPVRALVFLMREAGAVVSVTCGLGQCESPEELLRIGKLVEARVAELQWHKPEGN